MRPAPHDLRLLLALAGALGAVALLASPASAAAQERRVCASEILDPFEAVPRARSAGAAMGEIVAEILDPFVGVRAAPVRIVSEIVDPFATSATVSVARSEILDPWSG